MFTPATVQSDTSKTHVAQLQMPGNSSRLLRDVVTHSLPAVLSYSKAIHPFLRYLPCRSHVLVFMPSDSSSHVHKYLESLTERLAALYRGRYAKNHCIYHVHTIKLTFLIFLLNQVTIHISRCPSYEPASVLRAGRIRQRYSEHCDR